MKNRKIGVLLGGIAVMGAVSLGLAAVFTVFFAGGGLPVGAMEAVSWGITLVAAAVGALWGSRRSEKGPLPMSLCTGLAYFLLIFVFRGIFFREVGDRVIILFGCGFLGVAVGAFAAAGAGYGRKKRRFPA